MTSLSGTSISSAIIMPSAVAIPWPFSRRGISSVTLPSVPTDSLTSGMVGAPNCTSESPTS